MTARSMGDREKEGGSKKVTVPVPDWNSGVSLGLLASRIQLGAAPLTACGLGFPPVCLLPPAFASLILCSHVAGGTPRPKEFGVFFNTSVEHKQGTVFPPAV